LVRHRLAAYSQESQRYCDYAKEDVCYSAIAPPCFYIPPGIYERIETSTVIVWERQYPLPTYTLTDFEYDWIEDAWNSYNIYNKWRNRKILPEDARYKLPNESKTEVVTTYNLRQWRHVFKDRALNKKAQWEIRGLMLKVLSEFKRELPEVFGDL
jgi:thymidylate synthase (FAD)